MAPSNFGYSIKEAFRHFFRNWTTSFGAVITIFLSLFIIGLFIIGSVLVNSAIGNVEDQVTIQAYISDNASDEDVEDYQDELERMDNVKNVEFVSKEDALEEYSSTISGNADATLSALDGQNPLPRSFRIEMEDPSQVEAMAEHYTDYEDASAATKMKPENYADLTMKATDADGNEIAALTSESRLYGPGTGMFSEAFDEEILGMKKGQTKEFTLEVPEDETAVLLAGQAGKPVTFEVTCNVVKKKVTPEVTDEWAKEKMGFESVEDMRERIKESLNAQKGSLMPRIKENNIMVELRDRVEGDVPESLVEQAETSLLQDFFGQLQQAGMTFDAYLASQNITPDQFKADLKAQSADQVKEELALEAWARHNNMEITDADVTAEFAKTGVEDPAALEQEWRDAGRLHLIRTGLLRQKAIEDLMENANVTEVDFAAKAAEEKKAAKKPAKKKAAKKDEAEEAAE